MGLKSFVEIGDFGDRFDAKTSGFVGQDIVFGFIEIKFILNVADDLLEYVFNCHQSCDTAILINNDGDVIAVGLEFAQQDVEALRFRRKDGRTQHVAHIEFIGIGVIAQ